MTVRGRFKGVAAILTGIAAATVVATSPADGRVLQFVEKVDRYFGAGLPLDTAALTVFSSDGLFAYGRLSSNPAVAVFRRDPADGELALVQTLPTPTFPAFLVFGPGEDLLYAVDQGSITILERDASDGRLRSRRVYLDADIQAPRAARIPADGRHFYLFDDNGLLILSRDPSSGMLFPDGRRSQIGGRDLRNVSSATFAPDGETLYLAVAIDQTLNHTRTDLVVANRDPASGRLGLLESLDDLEAVFGAVAQCVNFTGLRVEAGQLAVELHGESVSVYGSYNDPDIFLDEVDQSASFQIEPNGALGAPSFGLGQRKSTQVEWVDLLGCEVPAPYPSEGPRFSFTLPGPLPERTGLDDPVSVAVSPDGRHVYAGSARSDTLTIFNRDDEGRLEESEVLSDQENLSYSSILRVLDSGDEILATGNTVDTYERDPVGGALRKTNRFDTSIGGRLVNWGDFCTSTNENQLYVVDSINSRIVLLNRLSDPPGFEVEQATNIQPLLTRARSIVCSPDGRDVYVGNTESSTLTQYRRNADTGHLRFESFAGIPRTVESPLRSTALAMTADGRMLFAGGEVVAAYRRNPESGRLWPPITTSSFSQGTADMLISGDQRLLFVSSFPRPVADDPELLDPLISVYAIQSSPSTLTPLQQLRYGDAGGVGEVIALALSPEGDNLYATSSTDDAVVVFAIAPGIPCTADCNGDGSVHTAEVVRAVNILLGLASADTCSTADGDGDSAVSVAELVQAVTAALQGCPSP